MTWRNKGLGLVVAVVCFALACGDDEDQSTPPTASPEVTAAPTAGPVEDLSVASPLADRITEAIAKKDATAIKAALYTQMISCVAEDSGQSGPFCPDGTAIGSTLEVISVAVCQGGWAAEIDEWVANILGTAGQPYALAELPVNGGDWPPDLYGETVLVFAPSGTDVTRSVALFLDDERIVRSQVGCRRADDFLKDNQGQALPILWRAP